MGLFDGDLNWFDRTLRVKWEPSTQRLWRVRPDVSSAVTLAFAVAVQSPSRHLKRIINSV